MTPRLSLSSKNIVYKEQGDGKASPASNHTGIAAFDTQKNDRERQLYFSKSRLNCA
jgi:hypothetical protein